MRVLYFDTETTGLRPEGTWVKGVHYDGHICQLACLVWEDGALCPYDRYFRVDYVEPSASAVNGLTVELLDQLSGGSTFADHVSEIEALFASADVLVAHNLAFDMRFLRTEMGRMGYRADWRAREVCSMLTMTDVLRIPGKYHPYKWPSLAELAAFYKVGDEDVYAFMTDLYGSRHDAHDARHDTVKMYLALHRAAATLPWLAEMLGLPN